MKMQENKKNIKKISKKTTKQLQSFDPFTGLFIIKRKIKQVTIKIINLP